MIRFSVIIPCRNRHELVAQAVRSCLAQTHVELDVIVIDDGSDPPLAGYLESDRRLRILANPGTGAAAARNAGIDAASGNYVAFLDSDDFFLPGHLERAAAVLSRAPGSIVYSPVQLDYGGPLRRLKPARGLRRGEDPVSYLLIGDGWMPTSSLIVPTALARRVRWDETLRYGDDTDFALRLHAAGGQFVFAHEPLVICRMDHGDRHLSLDRTGAPALVRWLARMEPILGARATRCYRATHLLALEGFRASRATWNAALSALIAGELPASVLVRSLGRGLLPQWLYRFALKASQRHTVGRTDRAGA